MRYPAHQLRTINHSSHRFAFRHAALLSVLLLLGVVVSGLAVGQWRRVSSAEITVNLKDNGGVANGGGDTSAPQSFVITINPCVNPANVTNTNDSGVGSLRDAINNVCPGGTINFDPALNGRTITLTSGELFIFQSLTIQGLGANLLTVSGNNNSRVFNVNVASPGIVTLSGLTIANGKVSSADGGGGIYNNSTGTINVSNSTLSNNSSGGGGGIYNNSTGTINVSNSTLSNNSGRFGGGIQNSSTGTVNVTNSTISGNSTPLGGGGITNTGTVNVTNSTISNNSASGGGGIDNHGTARIRNSIIALNTLGSPVGGPGGPDLLGPFTTQGHNLIGNNDQSTGFTNGSNSDKVGTVASPIDPLLGPLQNNGGTTATSALLPGSPAIDAGDNCVTQSSHCGDPNISQLTTDQRGTGFPRITNMTVDIGAFESRGFTIAATSGSSQSTPINTAFPAQLVATVSSASGEPVAGGVVTFTAPASGPSGTFPGNVTTVNITTDGSGIATSPTFTANGTAGGPYNVIASMGTGLPTANFGLTNLKGNQTITFGALANKTFGDPDFTVSATASSGLPVSFAASGQCTVAVNSVHITSPGSCTITAKQAGDANYNAAADVPQAFTIRGALVSLSQSNYNVNEGTGFVTITVNRTGDTSIPVSVDYATDDTGAPIQCAPVSGNTLASSRCDFGLTLGTLKFAATETQKTFVIPITQASYTEGPKMFTVNLSNLTGTGAGFASPSSATVTISDGATTLPPNAIDDTNVFVRMQYHDFLNREPDPAGLSFWTGEINNCTPKPQCLEVKRINVSAAFFLSIEFQTTGNLVRSFYVAALDRPLTNNMPAFVEFERDTQAVQRGVIVGPGNWQQTLNDNRDAFMKDFVTRTEFVGLYPTTDTPTQYVDKLYLHAGITPTLSERGNAIAEFGSATTAADAGARGRALLDVTQNTTFQQREMNRSFVQMEYFGYLRRNPNDAPDGNFAGYNFWLNKLNAAGGNYMSAEMVKSFIVSGEYRQRFGP